MIIYRIQDKNGRGPFQPGFSHQWVEERDDLTNLHPFFVEWPGYYPLSDMAYNEHAGVGCTSIPQLRRWFTEVEYNRLLSMGYEAVKLRVDRILKQSDKQCVFVRKKPLHRGAKVFSLYQ